jgi:hypothetical protein
MKFRTKTVLGVAVIEAVLLTILVLSTLGILQRTAEQELLHRAETTGKLLAAASRDALLAWDFATLDSIAQEATSSARLRYVRFMEKDGRVLARPYRDQDSSLVTVFAAAVPRPAPWWRLPSRPEGASAAAASARAARAQAARLAASRPAPAPASSPAAAARARARRAP